MGRLWRLFGCGFGWSGLLKHGRDARLDMLICAHQGGIIGICGRELVVFELIEKYGPACIVIRVVVIVVIVVIIFIPAVIAEGPRGAVRAFGVAE